MICSIKIQSENMEMTWNISLITFYMISNFSKWMALQFCKQLNIECGIKFFTAPLQPL